ncbi:MAG: single-stranded-DNA-specific exonuclease RecJ, partial [Porphyromonas sp.]|nr:single-stranded-DNA-specific exonuclease RecJ [Porphyromonas sp.]
MIKQWVIEDISAEEEALALEISVALTLNPIVSRLLVKRGVTSVSEARSFIDPKLNEQPNPYLMYGMDKAVSYLQRTMRSRKPIMITGDRDVDGVTSVALIHNALRDVFGYDSKLLHCYIPGGND